MGYEYIKGYSHYGSYDGLASVWGFGDDGKTDILPNIPPQKMPTSEQKEIAVMPPTPKPGVEVPTPVEQLPPDLPPEQLPDTDSSTERLRQRVIEKTTREGTPQQYMYDPKTGQTLVYDDKTGKYHPLQTFYPGMQAPTTPIGKAAPAEATHAPKGQIRMSLPTMQYASRRPVAKSRIRITPQQARLGKIAAAIGAGLLFL